MLHSASQAAPDRARAAGTAGPAPGGIVAVVVALIHPQAPRTRERTAEGAFQEKIAGALLQDGIITRYGRVDLVQQLFDLLEVFHDLSPSMGGGNPRHVGGARRWSRLGGGGTPAMAGS